MNIALSSYPLSSHGQRLFAWCMDAVVRFFILFNLTILLIAAVIRSPQVQDFFYNLMEQSLTVAWGGHHATIQYYKVIYLLLSALAVLWICSGILYYCIFEWLLHGRTLGKMIFSLRVISTTDRPLSVYAIFIRNLFRILDEIPIFWIFPLCTSHKQRLGDMAAGTLVVREVLTRREALRRHLLMRPVEEVVFRLEPPRLSLLKQADLQAIALLLERWPDLEPDQQIQHANQIVHWIARVLGIPCPQQYEQLVFLEDILTQALQQQHASGQKIA